MTHEPRDILKLLRDLRAIQRRFAHEEKGAITIFACFMVLIMLMVGGMGVDIMRHEMERTRMQAVADRAVLAAADLDQTLDPEVVVRDYFSKSGMADFVSDVQVSEGLNYRTVTVDAAMTMKTQFMDMLGVEDLGVPASSTAEEKVNKVEISMVVDISGSMNSNDKMDNLKDAASTFIDTVLKPSNEDLISISLVPYSEHVNAGPLIFDEMNVDQVHNYSHCIEFPDDEMDSIVLDTARTYEQMQHYQWNTYSIESGSQSNTLYDTVCPRKGFERIIPFSQDATYLKNQVDQLQPRAGTQIFLGMKWGAAMLDPSFRAINTQLVNGDDVDTAFLGRPADHSDVETLKTIILMTDGQNSSSSRISSYYYDEDSEIVHWSNYNFNYYLSRYVNRRYRSGYYYQKYYASLGDTLLDNICDAAKASNIVIWSIGFEVTDHGADVMQDCASSPSHFFRVEGVEISEAFEAIARQINQLRLTQ